MRFEDLRAPETSRSARLPRRWHKKSPLILAAKTAMLLFYRSVCPLVISNGTEFARLGEASERFGKDNLSDRKSVV